MKSFKQNFLGEFVIDHEYEDFVKGWMAYHTAADEVDGLLPPGHPDQRMLASFAVSAGWDAMTKVLGFSGNNPFNSGLMNDPEKAIKWQFAHNEAMRRLGR